MKSNPKRRKDKYNPYIITYLKDTNQYFIQFKDSKNHKQKLEISKEIFLAFNKFELTDISQMNKYDRHIEHSLINEITLNKRMIHKEESVEDIILNQITKESLYKAIFDLSKIQRRRIIMYYFLNFTQRKIAEKEGCSLRAVQYSIDSAIKKLKKIFKITS